MRHGTLALVRATMKGFVALPAPTWRKAWHEVLNVKSSATVSEINEAFKRLAAERHPDRGGSHTMMAELNVARDDGLKAFGS